MTLIVFTNFFYTDQKLIVNVVNFISSDITFSSFLTSLNISRRFLGYLQFILGPLSHYLVHRNRKFDETLFSTNFTCKISFKNVTIMNLRYLSNMLL